MSKRDSRSRQRGRRAGAQDRSRAAAAQQPGRAPAPMVIRALGAACVGIALAASLMLALDHFAVMRPPGCGPQSGCDLATSGPWGRVPLIGWPLALVGVAYFAAVLVGWIMSTSANSRISAAFRASVWLGGVASIALIAVMFVNGYLCRYCLAAHAANLAFIGVMEFALARRASAGDAPRMPAASASRPLLAATGAFILVTALLVPVHLQTIERRRARDLADQQASIDQLTREMQRRGADATQPDEGEPFTGRWRLGPENAPIRIVMFFDYQCSDCRIMEGEAMALVERLRDVVSLSVKHFPMSNKCNPHLNRDMHPNACWAARAAETAGMLRGNDGFWQMHRWLFARPKPGSFTDADFPPALQQLGYDAPEFLSIMQGPRPLEAVSADIAEGFELGLQMTPMIFINGVELRGFIGNAGALSREVNALAARNLPPGSPAQDRPPRGVDKGIADWQAQPEVSLPPPVRTRARGSDSAKVKIVMWGDYQEPGTALADRFIRQQIDAGRDIRYEFRHYPTDQACNPEMTATLFPHGCTAARAAEAAGALAGDDGYWKMHEWLMSHQQPLDDAALREAAGACGLDVEALRAKMNEPSIGSAIAQDARRGQRFVGTTIPAVYINDRRVLRSEVAGQNVLERVVRLAEAN